jgi:acyl-CoA thioester hydrolase
VKVRASDHVSTALLRVRYAETDKMGVAYHANYLAWFEIGRCEWLRSLGWSYRDMEADGTSLPVIEAHCEYRQPSRYDDEMEVRTRADLLSPVRVRFTYDIVRCADAVLAASGHTIHAATDAGGKPRRLPERIRTLFV